MEPPRSKEGFLGSPLRDLLPLWLELRCDPAHCTKVVCAPIRLYAAKRGGRLLLQDLIARLRCAQCHERPVHACITDSPIRVAPHDAAEGAKWWVIVAP